MNNLSHFRPATVVLELPTMEGQLLIHFLRSQHTYTMTSLFSSILLVQQQQQQQQQAQEQEQWPGRSSI